MFRVIVTRGLDNLLTEGQNLAKLTFRRKSSQIKHDNEYAA
jgi:hypothetical protein